MRQTARIFTAFMAMLVLLGALSLGAFGEKPTGIRLSASRKTLVRGNTFTLDYTIRPDEADEDLDVKWRTSDGDVAEVDSGGTVTAISPGTAYIYARTANGKSASCLITVPGRTSSELAEIYASNRSSRVPPEDRTSSSRSGSSSSGPKSVKLTEKLPREELLDLVRGTSGEPVTVTNYASVSTEALQASTGLNASKIHFDTKSGNTFVGRLTITPSEAKNLTGDVNTGVFAGTGNTSKVQSKFDKNFSNTTTVVRCAESNYHMPVEIAVKSPLSTDGLRVYSYNASSNTYTDLSVSDVRKDSKGYLHFTTTTGGYIILSGGALTK